MSADDRGWLGGPTRSFPQGVDGVDTTSEHTFVNISKSEIERLLTLGWVARDLFWLLVLLGADGQEAVSFTTADLESAWREHCSRSWNRGRVTSALRELEKTGLLILLSPIKEKHKIIKRSALSERARVNFNSVLKKNPAEPPCNPPTPGQASSSAPEKPDEENELSHATRREERGKTGNQNAETEAQKSLQVSAGINSDNAEVQGSGTNTSHGKNESKKSLQVHQGKSSENGSLRPLGTNTSHAAELGTNTSHGTNTSQNCQGLGTNTSHDTSKQSKVSFEFVSEDADLQSESSETPTHPGNSEASTPIQKSEAPDSEPAAPPPDPGNSEPTVDQEEVFKLSGETPDPVKVKAAFVDRLTLDLVDFWAARSGRTRVRPIPKRKAMVKGRLADGYKPDDLFRAIAGVCYSPFHVENGHDTFEVAIRNGQQVEKGIRLWCLHAHPSRIVDFQEKTGEIIEARQADVKRYLVQKKQEEENQKRLEALLAERAEQEKARQEEEQEEEEFMAGIWEHIAEISEEKRLKEEQGEPGTGAIPSE